MPCTVKHMLPDESIVTYAETDLCLHRRHWMTDEQMKAYDASPVVYSDHDAVIDAMNAMWGLDGESLIIEEVE